MYGSFPFTQLLLLNLNNQACHLSLFCDKTVYSVITVLLLISSFKFVAIVLYRIVTCRLHIYASIPMFLFFSAFMPYCHCMHSFRGVRFVQKVSLLSYINTRITYIFNRAFVFCATRLRMGRTACKVTRTTSQDAF